MALDKIKFTIYQLCPICNGTKKAVSDEGGTESECTHCNEDGYIEWGKGKGRLTEVE